VTPKLQQLVSMKAVFTPDRKHRYALWREWPDLLNRSSDTVPRFAMFIGLNPSTADETLDDPTIRRCIRFSKDWGFDAYCMTNLFAFRATDPNDMKAFSEPMGPENWEWIVDLGKQAGIVVAAWGNHGEFQGRGPELVELLRDSGIVIHALEVNQSTGMPKHPLYIKATTQPKEYKPNGRTPETPDSESNHQPSRRVSTARH